MCFLCSFQWSGIFFIFLKLSTPPPLSKKQLAAKYLARRKAFDDNFNRETVFKKTTTQELKIIAQLHNFFCHIGLN